MNKRAQELQRLQEHGQDIGQIPRQLTSDVLKAFKERFPDHHYALLGNGNIDLIVYPPLRDEELEEWWRVCDKLLTEFEGKPFRLACPLPQATTTRLAEGS